VVNRNPPAKSGLPPSAGLKAFMGLGSGGKPPKFYIIIIS